MKILNAYILREFVKTMAVCIFIFFTIYIIIDIIQKISNLLQADADVIVIIKYFLFKIPFIIVQMVPPALLLSIIIMISIMIKNNEILAIKICGIDIIVLLKAMLLCTVLLSVLVFLVSEYVVPYANSKSSDIWKYDVEKRKTGHFYGSDQIWYRAENRIYWIKDYDYYNKTLLNTAFYFFDDDFRVVTKIDGNMAVWENSKWVVKDALVQVADEEGFYRLHTYDEYVLDISETPETFVKEMRDPKELSFWRMKRFAEDMENDGYDNTRYLVDMHIKVAYPVVLVIMMMIGLSVPLIQKRVRIPLSVMAGILIFFLYMMVLGFSRSLGLSGVFPPFLAAWFANFLFFLFGAYLMSRVDR